MNLDKQISVKDTEKVSGLRQYNSNRESNGEQGLDNKLLFRCKQYWDNLYSIRQERRRNRDFREGKQWTKEELKSIKKLGGQALSQNYISVLVRNLMGQFLSNETAPSAIARMQDSAEASKMMSLAIESIISRNNDSIKDRDALEDMILGGVACCRIGWGHMPDKDESDVITQNINLNRLFFNTDIEDTNTSNLKIIGVIYDAAIEDLIVNFAKNESDRKYIEEIYSKQYSSIADIGYIENQTSEGLDNLDFFIPKNMSLCRYYEVWYKESRFVMDYWDKASGKTDVCDYTQKEIDQINNERMELAVASNIPVEEVGLIETSTRYEYVWKYKFLAPNGYVLQEGESPYEHHRHPFVLSFYTMTDGNIHPLVSDIIPQQKYINRLIQQIDFMMGRAAKGVLLLPDVAVDGMNEDDIARKWSSFNGVIKYHYDRNNPNAPLPQQVFGQVASHTAQEMFHSQLQMMQQIMGVNEAIQGQKASSQTPGSRYAMETENSMLNSRDLFNRFVYYLTLKYTMVMRLVHQYYDTPRYIAVGGEKGIEYDPEKTRDVEYDMMIVQSKSSPAVAMAENERLFALLQQQLIGLEQYLSLSTESFAPKLMEQVKQQQQELQQAQMQQQAGMMPQQGGGMTPQQME